MSEREDVESLARAIEPIMRTWGVRSHHGEWTDAEAQRDAAKNAATAALAWMRERQTVETAELAQGVADE